MKGKFTDDGKCVACEVTKRGVDPSKLIHKVKHVCMETEVMEQNKLIAEFMGATINEYGQILSGTVYLSSGDLNYHTSWDWLMPVVEKIGKLHSEGKVNRSDMTPEADRIFCLYLMMPIKPIYKTVVQFIKWFNSNTHQHG